MTKVKQEKELTMRQQLRVKAETELESIKHQALEQLGILCGGHGIDRSELVKAISVASHKTADHFLVTQLANRYETEVLKLWNMQQELPLEKSK